MVYGTKRQVEISTVRIVLFTIWVVAAFSYVLYFQWLGTIKDRAFTREAREAVWQIIYVSLPVLTAFGAFWFTPLHGQGQTVGNEKETSRHVISGEQLAGLLLITAFVHSVMWAYLLFNLNESAIQLHPADEANSVESIISSGMKLFVFLLSLAVLPVGYVTKSEVSMPEPSQSSE